MKKKVRNYEHYELNVGISIGTNYGRRRETKLENKEN